MAWNADGTRRPNSIFECGLWHYAVKPVCSCGHSSAFDPWGLWWLFERRGWNDHFWAAKGRFWCRMCSGRFKKRVRPVRLDTLKVAGGELMFPRPPEREWKKAVRRVRS